MDLKLMTGHLGLPLIVVALFSPGLLAQNHVSVSGGRSGHGPTSGAGHHSSLGISFSGGVHRQALRRSPYFYGAPYNYSEYDSYEPEYPAAPPAPQPTPVEQVKAEPVPDAVMLELRGNQWVKVTNFGEASVLGPEAAVQAPPQKEMPPAVLIYRDGHSEEVRSYSIIGHVMYAKSDYWSSGSWTRTIPISDLDVPTTLKQNQQRGVKFELPSGPDEVVIRP